MLTLAVETSTSKGSVAVGKDGQVLSQKFSLEAKSHSEDIHPLITAALQESGYNISQIDLLAVDQGPGNFTGVRVAINVTRALAYSLNKPVLIMDSLTLLSLQSSDPVVCMLNAFKNMIYFSHQTHGEKHIEPQAMTLAHFENTIKNMPSLPMLAVGDAYPVYQKNFSKQTLSCLKRNPQLSDFPSAEYLIQASVDPRFNHQTKAWNLVFPLYLRASSAEEMMNK